MTWAVYIYALLRTASLSRTEPIRIGPTYEALVSKYCTPILLSTSDDNIPAQ